MALMTSFKNFNWILWLSLVLLAIFSLFTFLFPVQMDGYITAGSVWVRDYFGTFYLWLGLGCVLFLIFLALSPYGKIRLGGYGTRPEFNRWSWIAMLYSAGMGAGILLRAVQEPVFMQQNPPISTGAPVEVIALEYTFYQWGFTAWAFYGLFALILGYTIYNRRRPVLMSAIATTNHRSLLAKSIDILTICTTVFGLVGAVGLGTVQVAGGIEHLSGWSIGTEVILLLLLGTCALAFISVWSGMNKGIKYISSINIATTIALLLYVCLWSDMGQVLHLFFTSLFQYIIDFIPLSLASGAYDPGVNFLTDWTYYYWAFWLAWAPFTGVFIARISRGRTFRELLLCVLIVPSLGTFMWFSVFGSSAFDVISGWGAYENEFGNVFTSIFVFFEQLPGALFLNIITIILLFGFLITSIDSAVFVLSMFTDKGSQTPKKSHRLLWSISSSLFAAAIVVLGAIRTETDVLQALQKLLIITSLPFALLIVVFTILFLKRLRENR